MGDPGHMNAFERQCENAAAVGSCAHSPLRYQPSQSRRPSGRRRHPFHRWRRDGYDNSSGYDNSRTKLSDCEMLAPM